MKQRNNVTTKPVKPTKPPKPTGSADKFRGKFRVASTRLENWDYRWDGDYFVTICTKNRVNYFGHVANETMHLNEFGKIANDYWLEIPKHFQNVKIDEFIVMPNHIHGIIVLENSMTAKTATDLYSKISPKPKSLSTIVRSYKSICTRTIHETHFETLQCNVSTIFEWQKGFYDHIIRNEQSLENIRNYIVNNPVNWIEDGNNISESEENGI